MSENNIPDPSNAEAAAKETIAEAANDAGQFVSDETIDTGASIKDTVVGGIGAAGAAAGSAKDTIAGGIGAAGAAFGSDHIADANNDADSSIPPLHPGGAVPTPDAPESGSATDSAEPQPEPLPAAAAQGSAAQGIAAQLEPAAGIYRVAADSRGRTKTQSEYRALSRRSLLTGAAGAAAAVFGWRTLQARPVDNRIPDVLRVGHEVNENIWRTLFRDGATAPTFDYAESSMLRVNGRHGIRDELVLDEWELRVVGRNGEQLGTHGVSDLRAMQQTEMTVKHKCVEGWSHVVTWGGVVFSEFLEQFYPEQSDAKFVGLSTPDNEFQVGLDMDSMMHSQTMLTLDLQREPLSEEHGAPVRLTTPLKYGTKQIKRIGTIEFSDTQPENDYWTVRGYDWYAGL